MAAPPSLDIIIPVRNGGQPLITTLNALAVSENRDFRLLISDNYSTDGAPWKKALTAFAEGQVELLQPPEPLGRVQHWTWAAQQAKADYCKLLLCGDRFPSDYLGRIRQTFASKPDLIFTPFVILEPGRTLEESMQNLRLHESTTSLTWLHFVSRCATGDNFIGPLSGVTFKTTSLQEALPFDTAHGWTADWRLYTAMMRQGTAISCESTYCIQDRTIARVSSSFTGVLQGIFEEKAYRRELAGLAQASLWQQWREAFFPISALVARRILPRPLAEGLIGRARSLLG